LPGVKWKVKIREQASLFNTLKPKDRASLLPGYWTVFVQDAGENLEEGGGKDKTAKNTLFDLTKDKLFIIHQKEKKQKKKEKHVFL
jgi:hypothetical protein